MLLELYTAVTGINTDLLLHQPRMEDVVQRVTEALREGALVALRPQPTAPEDEKSLRGGSLAASRPEATLPSVIEDHVEIEVVPTGALVVPLKWALPEYRPIVLCKIRIRDRNRFTPGWEASGKPRNNEAVNVELKGPGGQLRFHKPPSKLEDGFPSDSPPMETLRLTIPANHDWAFFGLSGELPSKKYGDADVVVSVGPKKDDVLKFRNGPNIHPKQGFTVFWFDQASIESEAVYDYRRTRVINEKTGELTDYHSAVDEEETRRNPNTFSGKPGVRHTASVAIKPDGIPCDTWQISRLYVGFIQNTISVFREETYGDPEISREGGVPAGTSAAVAKEIVETLTDNQQRNDTTKDSAPLYARPARILPEHVQAGGTISDNSLKPLLGCDGGEAATAEDAPGAYLHPEDFEYNFRAPGAKGAGFKGWVTYYPKRCRIKISFLVWVVVFRVPEHQFAPLSGKSSEKFLAKWWTERFCVLRQRKWELDYDSARTRPQRVTIGADADPTMPVIHEPFANDISNSDDSCWVENKIGKVSITAP